jgi:hypothetical protein
MLFYALIWALSRPGCPTSTRLAGGRTSGRIYRTDGRPDKPLDGLPDAPERVGNVNSLLGYSFLLVRCRLYGPGFSSDVAGDGPAITRSAAARHTTSQVPPPSSLPPEDTSSPSDASEYADDGTSVSSGYSTTSSYAEPATVPPPAAPSASDPGSAVSAAPVLEVPPGVPGPQSILGGIAQAVRCPLCPFETTPRGLAKHCRARHPGREAELRAAAEARGIQCLSFCAHCEMVFASGVGFVNHQAVCGRRRVPMRPARLSQPSASPSDAARMFASLPALVSSCFASISGCKCPPLRSLKTAPLHAFRALATSLLRDVVSASDPAPAIVALLGLPRIVDLYSSKPTQRLVDLLAGAAQSVPSYGPVLEVLGSWRPDAPGNGSQHAAGTREEIPTRRICELVQSNNIGLAVQTVESAFFHERPADPAAAREALAEKFPPGTDADLLPMETNPASALQLSFDTVSEALRTLPRLRAASFTGWTCDIVQKLGKEGRDFTTALLALFNALLRGAAGPAEFWSLDYVFPLQKKAGGIRPIVIGEIFPRILGRIVARALSSQAAEFLAPLQWGIGIPGGTETVAHAVATYFRTCNAPGATTGVFTVDFSNAFNTVRRACVDEEVAARFPELLPYFRFAYGRPTVLRGVDGVPMVTSATGVRQGDPLGPLLFCLGLDRVLRDVAAAFPEVHLLALLDDVTLLGPSAAIEGCFQALTDRALQVGLRVNQRKSMRLRVASDEPDAPRAEGTLVLGCAIGPDAFVERITRERLEEYTRILAPVSRLPSQIAVAVIQAAINARPVFTARTTLTLLAADAFSSFDRKIDGALALLAGTNAPVLPRHAQILRALPQAKGGLAIPRISELAPHAFAASFTAAAVSLAVKCPRLVEQLHLRAHVLRPVTELARSVTPAHFVLGNDGGEQAEDGWILPRCWVPPSEAPVDGDAAPFLEAPRQKVLTAALVSSQEEELVSLLSHSRGASALVRSAAHRGSAWFLSAMRFPLLRLSHQAMQVALSLRLLVVPPTPTLCRCSSCGMVVADPISCLTHGMDCNALQATRTSRHTLVRNALAEMLRKLFGAQSVHLEPRFDNAQLDVSVTMALGDRFIDVAIVNPGAASAPAAAAIQDDAAAVERAHRKRLQYAHVLASHGINAAEALVPFVIETTGRFGPDAKKFLDEVMVAATALGRDRDPTGTITYYIDRMKHIILEGVASLVLHSRGTLVPLLTVTADPVHEIPALPEQFVLPPQ